MKHHTAFALTLASLSFTLAAIWGRPLSRPLYHRRMGTATRVELPDSYQE
jgi:hypothetical protein